MGRPRKHRRDLPERVYHRHGAYYLVDGTGKWHRLGAAYADAMIRYTEILQGTEQTPVTLSHVMDRYMREIIPQKSPSTQRDQIRQLGLLRAVFGHMHPEDVTPKDIYAYMDRRPRTAGQRERALLSHIYTCAIRWGVAEENPCAKVRVDKQPRRQARYITDSEYRAARELAPPIVQAAMDLALLTGLRLGDLLRLRLQDCHEDGLRVRVGKTGAVVVYEWTDALRDAITRARAIPRKSVSMTILATSTGAPYSMSGWQSLWRRYQQKLKAAGKPGFRFHDLRRKAAADAEAAGGREYARALLAHASQSMTARYVGRMARVKPLK